MNFLIWGQHNLVKTFLVPFHTLSPVLDHQCHYLIHSFVFVPEQVSPTPIRRRVRPAGLQTTELPPPGAHGPALRCILGSAAAAASPDPQGPSNQALGGRWGKVTRRRGPVAPRRGRRTHHLSAKDSASRTRPVCFLHSRNPAARWAQNQSQDTVLAGHLWSASAHPSMRTDGGTEGTWELLYCALEQWGADRSRHPRESPALAPTEVDVYGTVPHTLNQLLRRKSAGDRLK